MLEKHIAKIKKIDFYKLFTYFLICAFIGWVYEITLDFIYAGHMTNRGLLFIERGITYDFLFFKDIPFVWGLPLVEIYGYGGVIAVLFISRLSNKTWNLFFIGMFLMTFLELVASYFCEITLRQTFWNYSNRFLNYQGRISLETSITWGMSTVLTIRFLKPRLEKIYAGEKLAKHYRFIVAFFGIYTLICIFAKYFYPLLQV